MTAMSWQPIGQNWVLLPRRPIAIVHFLGGAFVGVAPQFSYGKLLEAIAAQGYAIIATPFVNTFDHQAIATSVLNQLESTLDRLERSRALNPYLPLYGLGHSMGCKLHLLIGSLFDEKRAGNILMSFNNFDVDRAIPLGEWMRKAATVEFSPTPAQTRLLVQRHYPTPRNLLIRFHNDDLDQTQQIVHILGDRFADMVTLKRLQGNHLTPLGQTFQWQTQGQFSPLDALGQWFKQELYRDHAHLEQTILDWLHPLSKSF
ncbi:MAG TPA: DUF1350 family protein [Stenomitos sp.]